MDKLLEIVQTYKSNTQESGGGWIGAAIAGVVILVLVAVFAFSAMKQGKELAKLKHEKAVKEEEERRAVVEAAVAANEFAHRKARRKVDLLQKEITARIEEINDLYYERHKTQDIINRITSWEDVDKIVR